MKKVSLFFVAMCLMFSATVAQVHVCDGSHTHEHESKLYSEIQQAKEQNVHFENAMLPSVNPNVEVLKYFSNPDEVSFLGNISLDLKNNPVKAMNLSLPLNNETMVLELMEVPDNFYNYIVTTSEGETFAANKDIKHYRGIIKDDIHSTVAITFYKDEMMGLICTEEGNFNLVKETQSNKYLLYNDKNLKGTPPFVCGNTTDDFFNSYDPEVLLGERGVETLSKKVRFYVETEYDIFQNKGSVEAVETYVTFVFSQVYVLYHNEDITTEISEIHVWTTNDPFTGGNTDALLTQFQNYTTSINGDLGILLTFRNVGGGQAAGFSGLCNSNVKESLAVAMIDNYCPLVPTYSWTVMVCTHELGHLFGSRHTHACVWNGNNTAIDGCAGYVEGSCALPSGYPPGGGTIMSYCHMTNGINFSFGFGEQPGNLIRNKVTNAPCLLPDLPTTITFESLVINDSEENNNGRLNPGETVHLTVAMKNLTNQPVNNVQVKFTTADALVTVVNSQANYGNFAANEIKTVEDAFTIKLSQNAVGKHEIEATLEATFEGNTQKSFITITVYDYILELMSIKIPNENGIITPGETSDVNFYLKNAGNEAASNLTAKLTTTSQYLTINESTAYYGNLYPAKYKYRAYNVTLSPDTPENITYAPITLTVTDEWGRKTEFSDYLRFKNLGQIPQPCDPIKDLTAKIVESNIVLTWTAPASAPEKYVVYCNNIFLGETTETTYTLTNAEIGNYHFSVEALYADECTSEATCVEIIIPCDINVELTLVQEGEAFLLSWLPVIENGTFKIFKNSEFFVEVEGNEYLDSEVEADVMYCYTVTAVCPDDLESEPSNEACEVIVGINELQNDVKIYPNPTNGQLTIENEKLKIENVEIMDMMGRTHLKNFQLSTFNSQLIIDISSLSNGVYFIRIQTEKGTIMRKVVKQ